METLLELTFLKPGMQTTIQDHGRENFRSFGIPQGGPLDQRSAQLANWLVGNPESNPVLELTMVGPNINLEGEGYISLTGSLFKAKLNDKQLQQNTTVHLKGSHLLTLGPAVEGCRAYLAIAGDWQLEKWLNSCSTPVFMGKKFTINSIIEKGSGFSVINRRKVDIKSALKSTQEPKSLEVIRVLAGPEYPLFSTTNIKDFLGRAHTVTSQSNRMGYRLDFPLSNYNSPIKVISSGVVPGTIQVTNSGQLIVLMADAQTTGGYPRIANVLREDQDKLAQLRPGKQIRFKLVSLKDFS